MTSFSIRKVMILTVAGAALMGLAAQQLAAASPDGSANVTFIASGTFTAIPVSGQDQLKLSGQPFTIYVQGSSSLKPNKHGQNWAIFTPLKMKGTVYSGLIPGEPQPISSTSVELQQTIGATEDILICTFPVQVVGIDLTITAKIIVPGGTLTSALIRPFPNVAMDTTSTVTYANTTNSTVLGVLSGTLGATAP